MKAIRFVAHKLKQRILESEDFATLISLILIPGIFLMFLRVYWRRLVAEYRNYKPEGEWNQCNMPHPN